MMQHEIQLEHLLENPQTVWRAIEAVQRMRIDPSTVKTVLDAVGQLLSNDQPVVIPAGWKLVPLEPQPNQMFNSAFNLCAEFGQEFTQSNEAFARAVYSEFVKQAPAYSAAPERMPNPSRKNEDSPSTTKQKVAFIVAAVEAVMGMGRSHLSASVEESNIFVDEDDSFSALVTIDVKPLEGDSPTVACQRAIQVAIVDGAAVLIWGEDDEFLLTTGNLYADLFFNSLPLVEDEIATLRSQIAGMEKDAARWKFFARNYPGGNAAQIIEAEMAAGSTVGSGSIGNPAIAPTSTGDKP